MAQLAARVALNHEVPSSNLGTPAAREVVVGNQADTRPADPRWMWGDLGAVYLAIYNERIE